MRLPSARLVAQLQRRTAAGFYGDSAFLLIDVPTGSYDDYNNPATTETAVPIACSFTDKPTRELWRDYADIEDIEAEIRFKGPTPTKGNRIKLAGRFDGLNYTDKTFEIVDINDRDAFGFVCALKAVSV